jgi:hypothetical protein
MLYILYKSFFQREYDKCIVFSWDPSEVRPFRVVPIEDVGLHFKWWQGLYQFKQRVLRIEIDRLNSDHKFSILCKIVKGKFIFKIYIRCLFQHFLI